MMNSKEIISKLKLQPHPEGGFFKETYRSDELIDTKTLPSRFNGKRAFSTSIYYLLEGEDFSSFHKIKSDEIWHFYFGSPVVLHLIYENGDYANIELGNNISEGQNFQIIIPHNTWFAAEVKDKSSFTLVGCTVAPGFNFDDFLLADKSLLEEFPQHQNLIKKFLH